MFLEIRNKETKKVIGCQYLCHGCGDVSGIMTRGQLPNGWDAKFEAAFAKPRPGARCIRRALGLVENHYCGRCILFGCSARTVAATELKFARQDYVARQQRKGDSRGA